MNNIGKYKVKDTLNIRDAIKIMDIGGIGFCSVVNDKDFVIGIFTDGDLRRGILSGLSLDANILSIVNYNYKFLSSGSTKEDYISFFKDFSKIKHIPIIDNARLVDLVIKDELLFGDSKYENHLKILSKVVIMAGGKGTRLDPFTRILPKPLIPIGEKPIIEVIMDEFAKYGISNFYISINYKAKLIKAYFEDNEYNYNIQYIEEDKPLGTAGCLKHITGKVFDTFFVSNCDILIKENYSKIYEFHKKNEFDLTLIASMQHHIIPYGVCELETNGTLKLIKEKPQYDFLVNTGMYILEPNVLDIIPDNIFYNMTDLIDDLKKANKKVGVYPVSEKSWVDIGQWEEYKKTLNF